MSSMNNKSFTCSDTPR